jgi:hypothetical protein
MPERIQRKRTKGWKMPPNAVYVGRPSPVGNPFRVGIYSDNAAECVEMFRWCISDFPVPQNKIKAWRDHGGSTALLIGIASGALVEGLRGKDLACWCAPDKPCHADVLLEFANSTDQQSDGGSH